MTIKKAKEKGFTHVGYTYNIVKIYAKEVQTAEPEITGVNWFHNLILEIATWFDVKFQINDGFYMEVTDIK